MCVAFRLTTGYNLDSIVLLMHPSIFSCWLSYISIFLHPCSCLSVPTTGCGATRHKTTINREYVELFCGLQQQTVNQHQTITKTLTGVKFVYGESVSPLDKYSKQKSTRVNNHIFRAHPYGSTDISVCADVSRQFRPLDRRLNRRHNRRHNQRLNRRQRRRQDKRNSSLVRPNSEDEMLVFGSLGRVWLSFLLRLLKLGLSGCHRLQSGPVRDPLWFA